MDDFLNSTEEKATL